MEKSKPTSLHTVLLSAVFLLGNAVITVPYKNADRQNAISYILAAVISFLLLYPICFLLDRIFQGKTSIIGKILVGTVSCILVIAVAFEAIRCYLDFINFLSDSILPDTPLFLPAVIFALLSLWCGMQKETTVAKSAWLTAVITAVILPLFFLLSLPKLKLYHIMLYSLPEPKSLIYQTCVYLLRVFLPFVIVLLYTRLTSGSPRLKESRIGFASGGLLLFLCLISSITLFGAKISGDMEFAYADAISTLTLGNLYSRMDGFAYVVFFALTLVKIAVCIACIRRLLVQIFKSFSKKRKD